MSLNGLVKKVNSELTVYANAACGSDAFAVGVQIRARKKEGSRVLKLFPFGYFACGDEGFGIQGDEHDETSVYRVAAEILSRMADLGYVVPETNTFTQWLAIDKAKEYALKGGDRADV